MTSGCIKNKLLCHITHVSSYNVFDALKSNGAEDILIKLHLKSLTPETCPEGELVFEQSSELDEDVDVGVIETELLFPKKKNVYIYIYLFIYKIYC